MAPVKVEKGAKILTPEFRVSWPFIFAPRKADLAGSKDRYCVTMIFRTKADPKKPYEPVVSVESLKQIAFAEIVKKWGSDQANWPAKLRSPFRDGKEKNLDGFGDGVTFCTATSVQKPGLVDAAVQPIISPSDFYAGCYARATINAYAYDNKGNVGVSFGLHNIQKTRDGEVFSGRSAPDDDFDAIAPPVAATAAVGLTSTAVEAGGVKSFFGV